MNKPKNRLLSALSPSAYRRIKDYLEPIKLFQGQILIESNQNVKLLYFITQGIVSLLVTMQDGSTTAIMTMGKEGVVGLPQFLGRGLSHSQAMVQVKGSGIKLNFSVARKEFERGESLQKLLLQYNLKLFKRVSQTAACNNHHTVRQRTARLLLIIGDRLERDTFQMTQQLLSQMLGVRRTGVTEVASEIKNSGLIDYQRGQITLLDRPALEEIACECYHIIQD